MAAGGLQVVRRDAAWQGVEPQPPSGGVHSYQWSQLDAIVAALAQHGLRWYPTLDYSTSWSGQVAGDYFSAPAGTANYAAYATALAQRYGRGGSFWQAHPELTPYPITDYEIWNEENNSHFWHSQANAPEQYADLYLAARQAIKNVDPQANVVVGGLALSNTGVTDEIQFLNRMFAHRPDLKGNVDAVALHPYQTNVSDVYTRIRNFRQALDQDAGPTVPIEITEIGWTTTNTPDATRAADLTQIATDLPRSDCNIDRLIPHTWTTPEQNPANPEDWFGIYNNNATPKPSGQAYLNTVQTMRGLTPTPPPQNTITICHPEAPSASPAAAAAHGPTGASHSRLSLHLAIKKDFRRSRLQVMARCPGGCHLRVELRVPRLVTAKDAGKVTTRSTGFSSRQVVSLRIPARLRRRGRRAVVHVLAIDRSGARVSRTRRIRIH